MGAVLLLSFQPGWAGTVWLAGSEWFGGNGVNVYSKYSSDVGQRSYYNGVDVGLKWQCVELPGRFWNKMGWYYGAIYRNAKDIYPSATELGLTRHANGSGYVPVPGDLVCWNVGTYGHVAVIDYVTPTKIGFVEQNHSSICKGTMTRSGVNGSRVERDDGYAYGLCQGFVHNPKNKGDSGGGTDAAQMIAENFPDGSVLSPGQTFTKTFTLKNSGTTTWIANGPNGYTLNHIGDVPASPHLGAAYQAIPTNSIPPGGTYIFSIPLRAPTTPGNYEADFRMSSSASVYFGPKIWAKITVTPSAPTNDAALVSVTAPATVTAGQVFSATVVMHNTGNQTWASSGAVPHRLGAQSPPDNTVWGFSRVALPSSPIPPGQSATFVFNATAPVVSGTYPFAWRMIQEDLGWFGEVAARYITVASSGNLRYWDVNGPAIGAGGPSPGGAWTGNFWSVNAHGTNATGGWVSGGDAVFSAGTDAIGFFKVTGIPNTSWKSVTVARGHVQLEGNTITNLGTTGPGGTTLITVANGAYLSMTNAPGIFLAGKGLTKRGGGGLNVGGNEHYQGPTYLESGVTTIVSDLPHKLPFGTGAADSPQATIHLLSGATLSAGVPIPQNGTVIYLTNHYRLSLEGGDLEVGSGGSKFIVSARLIGDGGLRKQGSGMLTLSQSNSFGGGTVVHAGTLVANANGALSTGDVRVQSGARLALNGACWHTLSALQLHGSAMVTNGGANTVGALSFDGGLTFKRAGTWGSTLSGAAYQDNQRFAGAGKLTVLNGPESFTSLDAPFPAIYGERVTLTARVDLVDGPLPAAGLPTGTVTFYANGTPLGSPVIVTNGIASFSTTVLSVGDHTITADYSGDSTFGGSSAAAVVQFVAPIPTLTELTASANPSAVGSNVTFTATVRTSPPGLGIPTGEVVFSANRTPFSTNRLVSGTASTSLASLPSGTNQMEVAYAGDENFDGSVGELAQVVGAEQPCSQTNVLLAITVNPDNTITLIFQGTPQATYYVLACPNLVQEMARWEIQAGSTNVVTNPNGIWSFTVTNAGPQMFYRAAAVHACP